MVSRTDLKIVENTKKKSFAFPWVRTPGRPDRILVTILAELSYFLLLLCMPFKCRLDKNKRHKAGTSL